MNIDCSTLNPLSSRSIEPPEGDKSTQFNRLNEDDYGDLFL